MQVICQAVGPVEANSYIVTEGQAALIIDPGDEAKRLEGIVQSLGLKVEGILLTHAHFDHCSALDALAGAYHCPVYMNPAEFDFLSQPSKNASASFAGFPPLVLKTRPEILKEGEQKIGSFDVKAIYSPGHSIGSTIIQIGNCLFTGDVLFNGSIGRTDLYSGNADQMKQSLDYLKNLPGNFEVYPGHGPSSTLDYERSHNPYLLYPSLF